MLSRARVRRSALVATVVLAVVGLGGSAAAATSDAGPAPSSMASLGDSITRGFNSCGLYVDCPSESWSTGYDPAVDSHYLRILGVNPAIIGDNHNDAVTGAVAAGLAGQAATAVSQGVRYVTVLIGANDACRPTEAQMTPVSTFRSEIDAGLNAISAGLPNARIFVASIPDLKHLWWVGRDDLAAQAVWAVAGICQSMLANPTSTAPADVDRRNRVQHRVIDYNTQLAASCAARAHCRFDRDVVFNYPFSLAQLSAWDYFHPNIDGQATLARITYAAGFGW